MSANLEMLLDAERRADCARNDLALAMFTRTDTHRVLQVPRHPRSLGEAFKGPEYGAAIEIYRVPLLTRFFRFFRSGM